MRVPFFDDLKNIDYSLIPAKLRYHLNKSEIPKNDII